MWAFLTVGCDLFSLEERTWTDDTGGGIVVVTDDTDGTSSDDTGDDQGGDGGGPGGGGDGGGDGGSIDTAYVSYWWQGGAYVQGSSFEGYSWLQVYGSRSGDVLCELQFYSTSASPATGCTSCDYQWDVAWGETKVKVGDCLPFGLGTDTDFDFGLGFEAGAPDNYWGDGDGVLWYTYEERWYASYLGIPYWTDGNPDLFQWLEYWGYGYYYE